MNQSSDVIGKAGLAFFGKISASISHELKNALAVINESAGLLEDLTLMAQKGISIDPSRLLKTTQRIQQQVLRSDQILQNMNRFSHSVDQAPLRVDIQDLFSCLLFVTKRITDMKGIKVSLLPAAAPVSLTTDPFCLMLLLWRVLESVIVQVGESKSVICEVTKTSDSVNIRFGCPDAMITDKQEGGADDIPDELIFALASVISTDSGGRLLSLPGGC